MKYVIGNWKMNVTSKEIVNFSKGLRKFKFSKHSDMMFGLAVPYVYLLSMGKMQSNMMLVGAQNVSNFEKGAYTGEISAGMLADVGLDFSLVGHSERRTLFGETDEIVNEKLKALQKNNLLPILCIGENLEQYEKGQTKQVLAEQLKKDLVGFEKDREIIVAYEPIWAIGSGKSADIDTIKDTISFIKETLTEILGKKEHIVLYGGSVNPANSSEILLNDIVDGVLVGGASVDAERFMQIAACLF